MTTPIRIARRLLILDDHPLSLLATRCALEGYGHACETATTVGGALALARARPPDAVIYEWHLRHDPALGFATRIRACAPHPIEDMLVIIVSALDEPDGFVVREDVDVYLTKPVLADTIQAILHR